MDIFELCSKLSFAVCAGALICSIWVYPRAKNMTRTLSALNCFTIGVFFAGVLIFLPVHALAIEQMDFRVCLRVLFLAVTDSMRLFVLGIDLTVVENALPAVPERLRESFSLYAAFLYMLAPALSFTNVISYFNNVFGALWLRFCHFRKIYIMSELNVQSVAMAKEIVAKKRNRLIPPLIVFADVFTQNEEADYELRQEVKRLNAVCLKNDISHLRFAWWGRAVELFLLGENEAENVEQAKSLTERHRKKLRDISIYVYAAAPYTDHILDSLDKGKHLLHRRFRRWIRKNPQDVLYKSKWMEHSIPMGGNFSVRRIDPVDMLVKEVLTWNDYDDYKAIYEDARQDKTISITILGMGRYGTHFLKTAVWFYQRYGYRVEFNVIDIGAENSDPEKRLAQECPELISKGRSPEADEAQYDIRFFRGIDCLSADLTELVQEKDRLLRTKLVFIALGDDDTNIQAAMTMRMIFEQHQVRQKQEQIQGLRPFIYAVIYDDQKRSNLSFDSLRDGLVDHKNKSFNISFVGTLAAQYSYQGIEANNRQEEAAFKFHLDWTRKESQLRKCYETAKTEEKHEDLADCLAFKEELDKEMAKNSQSDPGWGDAYLFKDAEGNVNYKGPVNVDALMGTVEQYMRYAYYRNSSVAKAVHKEAISHLPEQYPAHSDICRCDGCRIKRITEHMRWNAYMRSLGFVVNDHDTRNHYRAKLHPDLKPWKDISCRERYKD